MKKLRTEENEKALKIYFISDNYMNKNELSSLLDDENILKRTCAVCIARLPQTNSSFCSEHSKKCSDIDPVTCDYFYPNLSLAAE